MGTGWAVIAYENTIKKFQQEFLSCEVTETYWVDQEKWRFENVTLPYTLLLAKRDGTYVLSPPCENRKLNVGIPGLSVVRWCALEGIEDFAKYKMGSTLRLYGLRNYTVPITEIPGCFTQPYLIQLIDRWIYLPRVSRGTMIRLSIGKETIVRWFPLPNFSNQDNPGGGKRGHANYLYKKYVDLHEEIGMIKSC